MSWRSQGTAGLSFKDTTLRTQERLLSVAQMHKLWFRRCSAFLPGTLCPLVTLWEPNICTGTCLFLTEMISYEMLLRPQCFIFSFTSQNLRWASIKTFSAAHFIPPLSGAGLKLDMWRCCGTRNKRMNLHRCTCPDWTVDDYCTLDAWVKRQVMAVRAAGYEWLTTFTGELYL